MDPITIGNLTLQSPAFLAPMTGVSDLPFRRTAHRLGAGLVISEMVASRELVNGRADVVRRALGNELNPFAIQLVGYDAQLMAKAAQIARDRGAQIIDINMGCPSREVTGKQSGSALMRDLDHAQSLIEAVVGAVDVPVTLKMRLGWDEKTKNAPELARRAQACGIKLLTVHARTRCQFFKGTADWTQIKTVKDAVSIPVIVNGDIKSFDCARNALEQSGADGIMIGRGAYGAPWRLAQISSALKNGSEQPDPARAEQKEIALPHIEDMMSHYGSSLGLKNARKHIGWYIEQVRDITQAQTKMWRRHLCTMENATEALNDFARFYDNPHEVPAQ